MGEALLRSGTWLVGSGARAALVILGAAIAWPGSWCWMGPFRRRRGPRHVPLPVGRDQPPRRQGGDGRLQLGLRSRRHHHRGRPTTAGPRSPTTRRGTRWRSPRRTSSPPAAIEAAARLLGVATVALIAVSAFVLAGAARQVTTVKAGSACVAVFTPSALHLSMWAMSDAFAAALTLAAVAAAADSTHRHGRRRAWTELLAGVLAAATALDSLQRHRRHRRRVAARAADAERLARRGRAAFRTAAPTVVVIVVNAAVDARRGTSPPPIAWHPSVSEDLAGLLDVLGMWTVGARSQAAERWAAVLLIVGLAVLTGLVVRRSRRVGPLADAPPCDRARRGRVRRAPTRGRRRDELPARRRCHAGSAGPRPARTAGGGARRRGARPAAAGIASHWRWSGCSSSSALLVPTGALPEGIARPDMDHPRPQLYQLVADLPPETILVANVPESLWRDTRRPSIVAPAREDKLTGRAIPDLPGRLREMGRLVGAVDGLLVLEQPSVFGVPVDSPRDLNPAEVAQYLPCAQVPTSPRPRAASTTSARARASDVVRAGHPRIAQRAAAHLACVVSQELAHELVGARRLRP